MILCVPFLLFALFAQADSELQESSSSQHGSCVYYEYLEERWQCKNSSHSYPLDYGFKYCTTFSKLAHKKSLALQKFLNDTALCLQNALRQFELGNKPSTDQCKELEAFAFGSHSSCYEQNNFHELALSDQAHVAKRLMNLDVLLKPRLSFAQGFEIGLLCAVTKVKGRHCNVQ